MPRFLSTDWASACNQALEEVLLPPLGDNAGIATASGRFTVAQLITGGPEGDVRLLLSVEGSALKLSVDRQQRDRENGRGDDEGAVAETDGTEPAGVTLRLAYEDAAALSRGELQPADAVTQGRVRVRGDLSILVAVQTLLDAARPALEPVHAATTY